MYTGQARKGCRKSQLPVAVVVVPSSVAVPPPSVLNLGIDVKLEDSPHRVLAVGNLHRRDGWKEGAISSCLGRERKVAHSQ